MTTVRIFIFMIVLVWVISCTNETVIPVDLSKRSDVTASRESDVITYAYLPQYSHRTSYQRHHLLIKYLRAETGLKIEQIFPDTFDEHIRMVGQGKIDITFSNHMVYALLAKSYGSQAFARIIELDGKAEFRGLIFTRSDNAAIRTLQDCRGKRWYAVDPASAGGYLFGLGHFYEHGIRKEDFAEIAFAPGPGGKSEKVVLAVHAGKYDFGTVREGTLAVVADKIDITEIRVIAQTRWYPGWVYSARKGLDPDVIARIREAMLRLDRGNPEHRRILEAATFSGIIPSHDRDFEALNALIATVGLPPGSPD
jgi:phosphonate transport system substrate-binding protein